MSVGRTLQSASFPRGDYCAFAARIAGGPNCKHCTHYAERHAG